MSKSILFALLAATATTMVCTSNAEARHRRTRCYSQSNTIVSPAPMNTIVSSNSMTVAPTPIAPNSSQTSTTGAPAVPATSTYQSYSYEPGGSEAVTTPSAATVPGQAMVTTAPVANYRAPVATRRTSAWSEYDSVLRGNRKVQP